MQTVKNPIVTAPFACAAAFAFFAGARAWEPNAQDLDAAISSGGFGGYFDNLTVWIGQKAAGVSEESLFALLKDPAFRSALDQRQLLFKHGPANVDAFAKASKENQAFLAWLLKNTQVMDLYLEGATPTRIRDREANGYSLNIRALAIWQNIYAADPDSREGLYLRLAIATAIDPPPGGNRGAGMAKTPPDPLARYQHFKNAHKNKELFPSFDNLTVWEMTKIVSSGALNENLAWAREMINSWRPDLRIKEQVVNSTSEVWRRNSPHPYTDYKAVLSGGGKCGPRSSWSVMICQAFGIPAIGVGQPAHACVAYKTYDPSLEPQPGSAWKVGYGRGWQFSRLDGMTGPEFLESVAERSRAAQFSQVERLRWIALALKAKEQAAAVMDIAHKIQKSATTEKTDLTASAKAAEAEKEIRPEVKSGKSAVPTGPITVSPAGTRIEAAAFASMSGVAVYDCYTGGKQVNFQKSIDKSWLDYTLDVPTAGTYVLTMRVAAANLDQVLGVDAGANLPTPVVKKGNDPKQPVAQPADGPAVTVKVPYTTGLWGMTPAAEIKLQQGKQTLRISALFQRGVALRYLELKLKE